jgi:outer membrane receptor protein involved in Fe transport
MFFDDNGLSARANPALRPETTDTFEIDAENQLSRKIRFVASVYRYHLNNLIQQSYASDGLLQYVNAERVRALGSSLELDYELPAGMRVSSTLEIQRAVFGGSTQPLPNSPGQVGKMQFSLPLWRNRVTLSTGLQALGQRQTYAGATLPWVILPAKLS